MFDELALHGNEILQKSITEDNKIIIPIRCPWYRNLALAVIESLRFTIDGTLYSSANDDVKILVEGEEVSISKICTEKRFTHIIWCNLDTQSAVMELKQPLADGEHQVKMEMTINLPYNTPVFTQTSAEGVVQGTGEVDYVAKGYPQLVEIEKTMKYEKGVF